MSEKMKAAFYSGVGTVEVGVRSIPEPKHNECLIKIESVGICGTDMAIFAGKHPRAKAPLIMGHEASGSVAHIEGDAPEGVTAGTRVTFFPLITCGECSTCKSGKEYVCENLRLIGIDRDGAMAEYMAAPSESVIPVPQNWDKNQGALIEPLAVALHAVRRSSIKPGDNVLITGAGIIGNLCGQMAKTAGAAEVMIADLIDYRLNIAGKVGLTPINLKKEDVPVRVQELTSGVGADVTMECSGSAGAQPLTIASTRVLGEIVIVGMPKEPPPVDLRMVTFKELTLVGTRVYEKIDFFRSIKLLEQHRINVDMLISHEYPIDRVKEAFDMMAKSSDSLKILLTL